MLTVLIHVLYLLFNLLLYRLVQFPLQLDHNWHIFKEIVFL